MFKDINKGLYTFNLDEKAKEYFEKVNAKANAPLNHKHPGKNHQVESRQRAPRQRGHKRQSQSRLRERDKTAGHAKQRPRCAARRQAHRHTDPLGPSRAPCARPRLRS